MHDDRKLVRLRKAFVSTDGSSELHEPLQKVEHCSRLIGGHHVTGIAHAGEHESLDYLDVARHLIVGRVDFPDLSRRRFVLVRVRPLQISDPVQRETFSADDIQQAVVDQDFVVVEQLSELLRRNGLKDIVTKHDLDSVVFVVEGPVADVHLSTTICLGDEFDVVDDIRGRIGLQVVEVGSKTGGIGEVGGGVDQVTVDE